MKKAFKKIYTRIEKITKATCTLTADGAGYEELALVDGRLAQVVKIMGRTSLRTVITSSVSSPRTRVTSSTSPVYNE